MYFYELKGPIFEVKTVKNDVETVEKQRSSEKPYVSTGFVRRPDSVGARIVPQQAAVNHVLCEEPRVLSGRKEMASAPCRKAARVAAGP
ncbi:MAG: hypothetical protein NTU74_01565 [Deltaproteobacteria bacterium]|nr:hypothetical protein [Deltaproteobacteria bacterium]